MFATNGSSNYLAETVSQMLRDTDGSCRQPTIITPSNANIADSKQAPTHDRKTANINV